MPRYFDLDRQTIPKQSSVMVEASQDELGFNDHHELVPEDVLLAKVNHVVLSLAKLGSVGTLLTELLE